VNDELERMLKEAAVALFSYTILAFACRDGETTKIFCQYSRSSGREMNLGPPEYKTEMLTTRTRLSVSCSHGGENEDDCLLGCCAV
jgi:hypothetical protein